MGKNREVREEEKARNEFKVYKNVQIDEKSIESRFDRETHL